MEILKHTKRSRTGTNKATKRRLPCKRQENRILRKRTERLGDVMNENGVKPTTDEMEGLTKTRPPKKNS